MVQNIDVDPTTLPHMDGPFALPGASNPAGLTVLDPSTLLKEDGTSLGGFWVPPDVCPYIHLHFPFNGHDDPAPGPPLTNSACGHGGLIYLDVAGNAIPPESVTRPPSSAKSKVLVIFLRLLINW